MCYVIEFIDEFLSGQQMKITTETLPHIDAKELNVLVTSKFDYFGIAVGQWDEKRPFKFTVPFGKDQIANIFSQHYESLPLKCKTSDPDYKSVQQCNVDYFISNDFPCPHKVEEQFNFHSLRSQFIFFGAFL